jgi:hypothetical protein
MDSKRPMATLLSDGHTELKTINHVLAQKQKDALIQLVTSRHNQLLAINNESKFVDAEQVAFELATKELNETAAVLTQRGIKVAAQTKEQKAKEFHDLANIIIFSRLIIRLLTSNDITETDLRELDYLSAPTFPFHQMKLSPEDLSIAWKHITRNFDLKAGEQKHVAHLLDAYLGTTLAPAEGKVEFPESVFHNKTLIYFDTLFARASHLQSPHFKTSDAKIASHYRPAKSDTRHQRLEQIRQQKDHEFKLHFKTVAGLQKADAILTALDHRTVYQRLDGAPGRSELAKSYCGMLVEEFKQAENNLKKLESESQQLLSEVAQSEKKLADLQAALYLAEQALRASEESQQKGIQQPDLAFKASANASSNGPLALLEQNIDRKRQLHKLNEKEIQQERQSFHLKEVEHQINLYKDHLAKHYLLREKYAKKHQENKVEYERQQQALIAMLDKALQHTIVKQHTHGSPRVSQEWQAIELIRDRIYPPFRDKFLLIETLRANSQSPSKYEEKHSSQLTPPPLSIKLAADSIFHCERKLRLLHGPERVMAKMYNHCISEYQDIIKILRFETLAKKVITAKKITSDDLHEMDKMMKQLPSKEVLASLWQAITSHYDVKKIHVIQKMALFFDCYFKITPPLQSQKIKLAERKKQSDDKSKYSSSSAMVNYMRDAFRPTTVNERIKQLDEFFKVACTPPPNNFRYDRYYRLKEIRNEIDHEFKKRVAREMNKLKKAEIYLEGLRHPCLYLRRDGKPGKSASAQQYCRDITLLVKDIDLELEQLSKVQLKIVNDSKIPADKKAQAELLLPNLRDQFQEFQGLLIKIEASKTFKLPLRGENRSSTKYRFVSEIKEKIRNKLGEISDLHFACGSGHLQTTRPNLGNSNIEYEPLMLRPRSSSDPTRTDTHGMGHNTARPEPIQKTDESWTLAGELGYKPNQKCSRATPR